jgi:uncharacterized membrane protein YdbT with pleckstrin-like domain
MSYVDSQLLSDEKVLHRSKLHWQVYLFPGFFSGILVLSSIGAFAGGNPVFGLCMLIVAAIIFLFPFLNRLSSEFAVTTKRVIFKVGIISTRTVELLHSKVESISVNQGLLGKMLGYGNIMVTGSGGTKETFKGVEAPLEFRRAVQAATEKTMP